ncbi:MAG: hypothetical protein ACYTFT_13490, partial [Planctomycetota bacterium]
MQAALGVALGEVAGLEGLFPEESPEDGCGLVRDPVGGKQVGHGYADGREVPVVLDRESHQDPLVFIGALCDAALRLEAERDRACVEGAEREPGEQRDPEAEQRPVVCAERLHERKGGEAD